MTHPHMEKHNVFQTFANGNYIDLKLLLKLFCDHFATVLNTFKSLNDSSPKILS